MGIGTRSGGSREVLPWGLRPCRSPHVRAPEASLQTQVRTLNDPWTLGGIELPNRVLLAPLAGIGNWFVRLQAKRYGAGMAFSEMVSSHAIHYRNEKTCTEMLRIHPAERTAGVGGPVSIQLFGEDPAMMRAAA